MCGLKKTTFKPNASNRGVYQRLYALYKQLHDSFGVAGHTEGLSGVMKDLLVIKEEANR